MNDAELNAIVEAIADTAIPRVDKQKLVAIYGPADGEAIAPQVLKLVREAGSMPIEWAT